MLGITETFTPSVARVAIQMSGPCDPSVLPNQDRILTELAREEERFSSTLETGPPFYSLYLSLGVPAPLSALLHVFPVTCACFNFLRKQDGMLWRMVCCVVELRTNPWLQSAQARNALAYHE